MSIELSSVTYTYNKGTAYESNAVSEVSFDIKNGEFVAIIGHTGSGKSTLIRHFNGLIRPTSGRVYYNGEDIWGTHYDRRMLRFNVGLVFQYPEHQFFEASVLKDVCFGPKNRGFSDSEADAAAKKALADVGLTDDIYERSPFEISGGLKRRVAIAGVLAMKPETIILDEPTAALDPRGKKEILNLLSKLHKERGMTVILVSHSMEDVAEYAQRIIVMNKGKTAFDGNPAEVFAHYEKLEKMSLSAPQVTYIMHALKAGGLSVDTSAVTVKEAKNSIVDALGREKCLKI